MSLSVVGGRRLVVAHATVHAKSCLWRSMAHNTKRGSQHTGGTVAQASIHEHVVMYLVAICKHAVSGQRYRGP